MRGLARAVAWAAVVTGTVVGVPVGTADGPADAATGSVPSYVRDVGFPGTAELSPVDQVRDARGAWYVLDEALQCIKVYPPTGKIRTIFTCGVGGNDATHIRRARGMGFDRTAQVLWVADTTNNRVLKVALDGRVLASSVAAGAPGGPFSTPVDVTVDDRGQAYVIDEKDRVVKLSSSGAYLQQWGTTGSGVGRLDVPQSIEFSAVGAPTLYVTDSENARVVKWGTDGAWKGTLGSPGVGLGQFTRQPRGIAVDAAGTVYASDVGSNRINRFDRAGKPLSPLGSGLPYYRSGRTDLFYGARGLWVDGSTLAVADMWNNRTLMWSLKGAWLSQLGGSKPPAGGHVEPRGVALDAAGNLYVSDYWHQYITKFAPDGRVLARWGIGRGSEPGTLNLPGGIDVDDKHRFLYIANREERVVDRWRLSDGRFDRRFPMPLTATGRGWPRDVAVDEAAGRMYAPDEKGKQVAVFDTDTGAVVRVVTTFGAQAKAIGVPLSVALDAQGNLFVADGDRNTVHVYDRSGRWLRDLDVLGVPRGLAVRGSVLYVLRANVAAFTTTGTFLYSFGARGSDAERLHAPYVGIDVGADGTVYVADSSVGRVKVYR